MDAFDRLDTNTGEVAPKFSRNEGKGDAFDRMPGPNNEFEKFFTNMFEGSEGVIEGTAKVLNKIPGVRTALQVPLGIAQGTGYGIITGLLDLIGTGEALSPDTIDELRIAHERAGKPFDEEEYINAVHKVASEFPTPGNIARMVEEKTDLPLTPKSRLDKFVNLASTAGKMAPAKTTFRGMETALPKPILGTGVSATKEVLDETGLLPEPINELLAFGILKQAPSGKSLSFGQKTKPSGMLERGFEGITKSREVTEGKHAKITEKLEGDFKEIANKIIEESPIGETAKALAEDPLIQRKAEELMNRATEVASKQKNPIATVNLKKEMADNVSKNVKGYALSEYEKSYMKYMKEAIDEILPKNITAVELVEQYRKNNKSMAESFEPGSSKAINNAKRDALLDHNRAIAQVMEKTNPELAEVFKEGNANWANIKNAEAIDEFISTVFKEGKINFKEMKDAFNDKNYQRIFKTALGEKGAAQFEQLMTDMLTSEKPYKMLKIAKSNGFWKEAAQTGILSYLSPKAAITKLGYKGGKEGFKFLMNSLLDKPKLTIKLNRAVQDLKKGDFAAAEKGFKEVDAELLPKETGKGGAKASEARGETIEVKGERIEPKGEPEPAPAKAEAPKQLEAPKKQIEHKEPEAPKAPATKEVKAEPVKESPAPEPFTKQDLIKEMKKDSAETGSENLKRSKLIQDELKKYPKEEIEWIYREAYPHITEKALDLMLAKHGIKPKSKPKAKIAEKAVEENSNQKQIDALEFENKSLYKEIFNEKGQQRPMNQSDRLKKMSQMTENGRKLDSLKKTKSPAKKAQEAAAKKGKSVEDIIAELDKKYPENKKYPESKKTKILPESKVKIVERQDITPKGLKAQKQWLVKQLDQAISKAPEGYEGFGKNLDHSPYGKDTSAYKVRKSYADEYELLTFEIPGDGIMKIKNHKKALEAFKSSVEKRWPEKASSTPQKRNTSIPKLTKEELDSMRVR